MQIRILEYIEGARNATGLTVVIDVFRAFTVGCYVMKNGAEKIIAVGEVDRAFQLKQENPGYILMGERDEQKIEGFDYGNSPTHIEHIDFTGKTVVQTTSAGTQGLILATGAEEVITGSLVNADAVAVYIQNKKPVVVSLVAMGYAGKIHAEEDRFCAEYIRARLLDQRIDPGNVIDKLKRGSGKRFFNPEKSNFSPPNDFYLCTQIGIFDFVLKAEGIFSNSVVLKKHTL
jgi:2-phosphosulfolactate phosphatase